jgi:hypothetical protein
MQQQTLRILAGGLSDTSLAKALKLNRSCRERLKSEPHDPAAPCVVFFGQSFVVFDHL